MKKLFALLLVLMLIVSAMSALAEERFSVRNGIMFGMLPDEVKEIEKNNDSGECKETEGENSKGKWTRLSYTPNSLAGLEEGNISYSFGKEGLKKIQYIWGDNDGDYDSRYLNNFNTLNDVLEDKYEKVGELKNSDTLTGLDIDEVKDEIRFPGTGKNGFTTTKVIGFNEYIVEDGDDYVIMTIEYYKRITGLGNDIRSVDYWLNLNYIPVSRDKITALYDKAIKNENERNSDL